MHFRLDERNARSIVQYLLLMVHLQHLRLLKLPEGGSEDGLVADDAAAEEVVHGWATEEELAQLLPDVALVLLMVEVGLRGGGGGGARGGAQGRDGGQAPVGLVSVDWSRQGHGGGALATVSVGLVTTTQDLHLQTLGPADLDLVFW